jgi:septal ring factor EnvC (AmiA/AmiB activator)
LLAGLSSSDTQTGQSLLAGEPIGIMPDNENAKLYMEIRKDQNPINPEPWLEK